MKVKILSILPFWLEDLFRSMRRILFSIAYYGNNRWCPVCEKPSRIFRTSGLSARKDAMCVHCDALERHRFVWLFFTKMTDLFDGRKKEILHIAPEKCIESKLKSKLGKGYITADLMNRRAMVQMDITDIKYPDEYFDVIYCSHVLEHVKDDKKAIREFYRIIKKSGWAVILVPINADKTMEDFSFESAAERLEHFGQEDHLRQYGPDFKDRLKEAGFEVKVYSANKLFNNEDCIRMGLTYASGDIFYCTKS
jgi:predicted SAM-dependent methyltransferase